MEKFSITLLLFVILGSAYCNFLESCQFVAAMECRNPSIESALGNLNGKLPDEDFLKEHCEPLIEYLDCLLEHEKTCPLSDAFYHGPPNRFRGLSGTKQLVEDTCDEDSSLRTDYLQTVSCLEEHRNEVREGLTEMNSMINQFNRHYLMENEENRIMDDIVTCVTFAFGFNEIKNILQKHCGSVASNVFVTMANHVVIIESDQCSEDQENFDRLTELLESFRSSDENIRVNSIE